MGKNITCCHGPLLRQQQNKFLLYHEDFTIFWWKTLQPWDWKQIFQVKNIPSQPHNFLFGRLNAISNKSFVTGDVFWRHYGSKHMPLNKLLLQHLSFTWYGLQTAPFQQTALGHAFCWNVVLWARLECQGEQEGVHLFCENRRAGQFNGRRLGEDAAASAQGRILRLWSVDSTPGVERYTCDN